jgi:hypothetical protein
MIDFRRNFATEVRRVRGLYGRDAIDNLVAIAPAEGAKDRNPGWYPETQKSADELFAKLLGAP